jgi:membrane protein YqaA with SNARE-associated domain
MILIGYAGLFVAAFVAANLLPAQSELVLAAMIAAGRNDLAVLLIVATIGNVLGSAVNWASGRFLSAHRDAKWFPVSARALDRAEQWFEKWGSWILFLSWVPIVAVRALHRDRHHCQKRALCLRHDGGTRFRFILIARCATDDRSRSLT